MIYAEVDDMRDSEGEAFEYIKKENIKACPYNNHLESNGRD